MSDYITNSEFGGFAPIVGNYGASSYTDVPATSFNGGTIPDLLNTVGGVLKTGVQVANTYNQFENLIHGDPAGGAGGAFPSPDMYPPINGNEAAMYQQLDDAAQRILEDQTARQLNLMYKNALATAHQQEMMQVIESISKVNKVTEMMIQKV